jgi:hypothetical protein
VAPIETANDAQSPAAPKRFALARARAVAARIATSFLGLFCLIYGTIAALSPLPAGAPLVIFGLLLIALANPRARPLVRRLRRRFRWFDRLVRSIAGRSRGEMKALIEETDPKV